MRKFLHLVAIFAILSLYSFGQAPEKINYQAVVRDVNDNVVRSQAVGVQFKIRQLSDDGTVVYTETFATNSNTYGLISLEVGSGTTGDDFSTIEWGNGPYFLETAIDVSGGTTYAITGVSKFLSTPYSLYSNTAGYANGADYNTLLNPPTTITQGQINKIDLITVTEAIDLDQIAQDVETNNAKVSFPGFGTVPGKALEGNNFIWQKVNDDIFYNSGNVGIGVSTSSGFGGSKLHIGGGILYDGIPQTFAPGLLYYDNTGTGTFHYVDENNADIVLNNNIIYTDTLWKLSHADVYTNKDVIMQSSLGVGFDATNGMGFGFNTIILKENNLRILFDDSDESGGTMPANDWQLEANESANGGTNHFAIRDETAGTAPFKIIAGASNNSLFINDAGNVGIGTSLPTVALEVVGSIKATNFIGDGSGLTGFTGATGGVSDIGDVTIGADTDNSNVGEIALQTQNTSRLTISNNGNVGIGTTSPASLLEVNGSATFQDLNTVGNITAKSVIVGVTNETYNVVGSLDYDVAGKSIITINASTAQDITGFKSGISGQEITLTSIGAGTITIKHNYTGTQKILLAASTDIVLGQYKTARFVCDGTNWYCIGLNN